MDYELIAELQPRLNAGERLLWVGQPKSGILFRQTDLFLIPFSLLWCGIAIFWMFLTLSRGAPLLFVVFGIPFVVSGLIFVFGRYIIDAKHRKNTFYGLTDERVIIKSGIFKRSIQSFPVRSISEIQFGEKKDGSGTINIGPKNPMMMWNAGMDWWPGTKSGSALHMIPDVKMVYNRIVEMQKA